MGFLEDLEEEKDIDVIDELIKIKKPCGTPDCENKIELEQDICNSCKKKLTPVKKKNYYKESFMYDKNINLVIPSRQHLVSKLIPIRCSAHGINGRCASKFYITYQIGRTTYPRYCKAHQNEYQRYLFEKVAHENPIKISSK